MMDHMDCLLSRDSLPDFFPESLGRIADASLHALHAPHKRAWNEVCCELLDDSSALHEWPMPAKRARRGGARGDARGDARENGNSLGGHTFLERNATPSVFGSTPFCPARPRAYAMDVYEGTETTAGDVVPPLRDIGRRENVSLFVRFAQLASCNGVTPLHLPSPDKFPTTMQMEAIVRAIVAA